MHKPPKKLKRGFRRLVEAYNALIDYIYKTHPIPAHGYRETIHGTFPRRPTEPILPQFSPIITTGTNPKIEISPGYIYSQYIDDATADSSTSQSGGKDFPDLQSATIEPTINGRKLSADPAPALTVSYPANNYIYLKLTWRAYRSRPGGAIFDIKHNLKITYPTGTETDQKDGTNPLPGIRHHTHGIDVTGIHVDPGQSADNETGISCGIDCILYSLSTAEFIIQDYQAPPPETEVTTYMPAGYITLDDTGKITTGTVLSDDDDGFRWFLNGSIRAWRDKQYVSSVEEDEDRDEPVAPSDHEGYVMPGQTTDD